MQTILIVNPQANKGKVRGLLPQIEEILKTLDISFEVRYTQFPGHGIQLTHQAALSPDRQVVAVGGDGICNEVVNGLLQEAALTSQTPFGLIPVGSGNDFAYSAGIPTDIEAACELLKTGTTRPVDIGRVKVDGQTRFFDNSVGLGFDAEAVVGLAENKKFQGFFMYLWSVFRVLVSGRWPYQMTITLNEKQINQKITLLTVANGKRAGGGFLLTPKAIIDDGWLDMCYGGSLSRGQLLALLPKTLNGSHIHHPQITTTTAQNIKISAPEGVPAHIDGEILCLAGREFEFEILPQALMMRVG